MRFRLFAVIMVVAAGFGGLAQAQPDSITVTIEIGSVRVPVVINGRRRFTFLLDTGSSHSVVSRSLASELGLEPVARTSVLTSDRS